MNRSVSLFLLAVLHFPAVQPALAAERYALIIGIDGYQELGKLTTCVADAKALAKVLIERCGFPEAKVVLLTDDAAEPQNKPTLGTIRRRIGQFRQLTEKGDTILLFFSGHGLTKDKEKPGEKEGFLIPIDGDPANAIPVSWVVEEIEKSPAATKLLVLDTCHAGAAKGVGGIAPSMTTTLMLLSCGKDQVSYPDEASNHSIFSKFLIEALRGLADADGDGSVTVAEIFSYVRKEMIVWCWTTGKNQVPEIHGPHREMVPIARVGSVVPRESRDPSRKPWGSVAPAVMSRVAQAGPRLANGLRLSLRTDKPEYEEGEPMVVDLRIENVTTGAGAEGARDIPVYFEPIAAGQGGTAVEWLFNFEIRTEPDKRLVYQSPDVRFPEADRMKYYHYIVLQPQSFVGRRFVFLPSRIKGLGAPGHYRLVAKYTVGDDTAYIIINRNLTSEQVQLLGRELGYVPVWTGQLVATPVSFAIVPKGTSSAKAERDATADRPKSEKLEELRDRPSKLTRRHDGLLLHVRADKERYALDDPISLDVELVNCSGQSRTGADEPRDVSVYFEPVAKTPKGEAAEWLFKFYAYDVHSGRRCYISPQFEVPVAQRGDLYHHVTLPPNAFVGRRFTFAPARQWLAPGDYFFIASYEVGDDSGLVILHPELTAAQAKALGNDLAYVRVWTGRVYSDVIVFRVEGK